MLIRGTRQFSDEEKVELFKSQWKRTSKANMGKMAKGLPANMVTDVWDEAMIGLETKHNVLVAAFSPLLLAGGSVSWGTSQSRYSPSAVFSSGGGSPPTTLTGSLALVAGGPHPPSGLALAQSPPHHPTPPLPAAVEECKKVAE